ncbi:hypothetical protein N9L20_08240 [Flavobacteriaceae bacterium]|nr:hypothetical protein [Flavobacteriaceae bacterium]
MNAAKIISYTFHPAVVPTMALLLYFILLPGPYNPDLRSLVILIVFLGTYIIPILSMVLFKQLGLIDSLQVEKVQQRSYPVLLMLVISLVFYYIFAVKFNNLDLSELYLSSGLSIAVLFFIQLRGYKLSIHMMAFAALLGFVIKLSISYHLAMLLPIMLITLLLGLVASARLSLKAHSAIEVLLGLALGLLPQLLWI